MIIFASLLVLFSDTQLARRYSLYNSLHNKLDKIEAIEVSRLLILPLNNIGNTALAEIHYAKIQSSSNRNDLCQDLGRMMNSALVFSTVMEAENLRRKFGSDIDRIVGKFSWDEASKNDENVPSCFPALTLALC